MNLQLLTKQNITKTDIDNTVEQIFNQVENEGTMNPLDVLTRAKVLGELSNGLKEKLTELGIEEFRNYGQGEDVSFNGIEITLKSRKPGLNYEQDPEFKRLSDALTQRKKDLDDAFTNFQKGRETVIDGELIPVVQSKGKGSEFFNFKLDK